MPFYDLYCPGCDEEYNISASMADKIERNIPCPDCGSTQLETVYRSAPAIMRHHGSPCSEGAGCGAACPHAGRH